MKLFENKKKILIFLLLISGVAGLVYFLYNTYAIDNSQIIFGVNDSNSITLAPGESKIVLYQVRNNNNGTLQYGVAYNNKNNIDVKYLGGKGDLPIDIIRKSETKSILLELTNLNSSFNSSFDLKTFYGFEKGGDIGVVVPSDYNLVTEAIINCLIRYDVNGGSNIPTTSQNVTSSRVNLLSDVPTKKGYDFLGWSTNKDSTSAQYSAGQNIIVNGDMTLYAIWKARTFTVTYDANGGTGAPSNQIGVFDSPFTFSSVIPSRAKYQFVDWVDSSGEHWPAGYTDGLWIWDNGNYGVKNNTLNLKAVWALKRVTINDFNFTGSGQNDFINDGNENWRYKIKSSGTLTVTKDMLVDIFLVGGGGAGGVGDLNAGRDGGGGGGGYTTTVTSVSLKANQPYEIYIGRGGAQWGRPNGERTYLKISGGDYLVGNNNRSSYADGGSAGTGGLSCNGGSGGSGGGAGGNYSAKVSPAAGGSNGNSGVSNNSSICAAGSGQKNQFGVTTEFGEDNGIYYSGGGGGSYRDSSGAAGGKGGGGKGGSYNAGAAGNGEPNTGGGGGGRGWNSSASGNGGSGIVILRNAR